MVYSYCSSFTLCCNYITIDLLVVKVACCQRSDCAERGYGLWAAVGGSLGGSVMETPTGATTARGTDECENVGAEDSVGRPEIQMISSITALVPSLGLYGHIT